jgi:hypothetical protein
MLNDKNGIAAQRYLSETQVGEAFQHFSGLPYQGKSIKTVTENISGKNIGIWSRATETLPGFMFNFVRKALQSQLPTKANLQRWGRSASNLCPLCSAVQSNKHVLSNCSNPVVLDRFTERHNKILQIIATWMQSKMDRQSELFVDLPGFKQTADLFNQFRPDMALRKCNKICVVELTICHETNLVSLRAFKETKYRNIDSHKSELIKDCTIEVSTCEISALGFVRFDDLLLKDFAIPNFDELIMNSLIRCVTQSSFDIYVRRDSVI